MPRNQYSNAELAAGLRNLVLAIGEMIEAMQSEWSPDKRSSILGHPKQTVTLSRNQLDSFMQEEEVDGFTLSSERFELKFCPDCGSDVKGFRCKCGHYINRPGR